MDVQPSNPPASIICTIEGITRNSEYYRNRKVRFLGCIDMYDIDHAIVTLMHCSQSLQVDVSLLVDDLRFSLAEWVNVVGYLEQTETVPSQWIVKAVMVWGVSLGFNIIEYENTVKSRIETIF